MAVGSEASAMVSDWACAPAASPNRAASAAARMQEAYMGVSWEQGPVGMGTESGNGLGQAQHGDARAHIGQGRHDQYAVVVGRGESLARVPAEQRARARQLLQPAPRLRKTHIGALGGNRMRNAQRLLARRVGSKPVARQVGAVQRAG